jgi:benzoylformate decarboxylase
MNRVPLVVLVGQQDRRHLALDPFLAGRLDGLAGDYPVWVDQPVRAQDVPGAIVRAYHEATTAKGPAIVIVPLDDWLQPGPDPHEVLGPRRLLRGTAADPAVVDEFAAFLDDARAPAIVAGAGNDSPAGWAALVALAQRLGCPVWQEPFGGAAGFPQDHPRFAGHLPARRTRVREALAGHDAVLVVGTGAFRQYPYDTGGFAHADTRLAVITADRDEAHRSPVDLAVLADPAVVVAALARRVDERAAPDAPARTAPASPAPPAPGAPLLPGHVLDVIAQHLPADAILVEESPSSRPEINARLPTRAPLGYVSAMGLLGFALPATVGLRMARPDRPVIALVGDGASLYSIQALWTATRYGVGALFVVFVNGGYAIMDRLAEKQGGAGPWPKVDDVDIGAIARAQGCETRRLGDLAAVRATFAEVLPALAARDTPLLLEVLVGQDEHFDP